RLDPGEVTGLNSTIRSVTPELNEPVRPDAASNAQDRSARLVSVTELIQMPDGGTTRIRRSMLVRGFGTSLSNSFGVEADISREDDTEGSGRVILAAATGRIARGELSVLSVDPLAYADARVLPWPAEETRSIAIGTERFVRGLDGWRRGSGPPVSPGESRGVDAALAFLGRGDAVPVLAIDGTDATHSATSVPVTFRRLGIGDEVTLWADLSDGGFTIRDGDAVWSWSEDSRALGWLRERVEAAITGNEARP
ncbi:MAG: hypothetical protein AAF235_11295, partial [Planctomycetota bacterium]